MKAKLQLLAGGIGFPLIGYIVRHMMIETGSYGWIDAIFYYSMLVFGGACFIPLSIPLIFGFLNIIIGTITRGFDFLMGFVKGFRVVKNSKVKR
jgi:hypothetical protein